MPFEVFIAPDVQINSNTDAKRDDDKHCGLWMHMYNINRTCAMFILCLTLESLLPFETLQSQTFIFYYEKSTSFQFKRLQMPHAEIKTASL